MQYRPNDTEAATARSARYQHLQEPRAELLSSVDVHDGLIVLKVVADYQVGSFAFPCHTTDGLTSTSGKYAGALPIHPLDYDLGLGLLQQALDAEGFSQLSVFQ